MRFQASILLVALLLTVPVLAGCLGATGPQDPAGSELPDAPEETDWEARLPETITGLEHRLQVEDIEAAAGIYAHGDHLYVSGTNSGFYVVDISDPPNATVVGQLRSDAISYNRDVDLLHYANRTVAVVAQSGTGMTFIDVTDPTDPSILTEGFLGGGLDADGSNGNVHNMAVVPGTHVVYNSRSVDTPGVDIVDASDPEDPERVDVFGDLTCHDVTFWMDGDRAYCPGVRETQIWDVSDPAQPEVISRIYNPAIQIHHAAVPAGNGSLLIILDEFAGSSGAAYGCLAHQEAGGRGNADPVGAAWIYDISNEMAPVPLSWIAPDAPTDNGPGMAPCTAHFGTTVEDRDLAVVGWRTAGTYLLDFSDPVNPTFLDSFDEDVETWEARYHDGFAYTGDTARGVDVVGFLGE